MLKQRRTSEELARRSGGVFTAGDAAKSGVHPRSLYALRDEGFLVELSRGVFRLADAEMGPYLDLIAVSRRSPQGAICLNSALSFWDLIGVAYEALRRYLRRPDASPSDLLLLARRLRAGGPMSDALEVLTG